MLFLSACKNDQDNQPVESEAAAITQDDNQPVESVDTSTTQPDKRDYQSQILKVDTDLEMNNGWHIVPEDINTMIISVEAENVETILFWISETGTGTWDERELIGYDKDGSDGWSIEWDFGDRVLHDHISVQALGSDHTTQANTSINVHSADKTDKK
ncbi:hypothetical protein [Radiobacillus sp. PE A8.2]|uniref:hypothetical protein n=1 Tax=Radiobacillus sp. PE A8.2 TaxID=3380349 RepID=UPI0038901790